MVHGARVLRGLEGAKTSMETRSVSLDSTIFLEDTVPTCLNLSIAVWIGEYV